MASAEEILRDAQYAFHNISAGDSITNRRNIRRAKSLAMKLLRKYPGTKEASFAHSMMLRFGDASYGTHIEKMRNHSSIIPAPVTSTIRKIHKHATITTAPETSLFQKAHAHATPEKPHRHQFTADNQTSADKWNSSAIELDWIGLMKLLRKLPSAAYAAVFFIGFVLIGIFGWFLVVPLILLVLFATPLRRVLPAENQSGINETIATVNAFLAEADKKP